MAKTQTKAQVQITRGVFAYLAFIGAAILIVIAGLAWWGHVTISNMVTHELSVQKIYFPEKGSAALDPETYPGLQQYAGQLVDTPDKAKAYANEYIGKAPRADCRGQNLLRSKYRRKSRSHQHHTPTTKSSTLSG